VGQGLQETGLGAFIDCLWADIEGMPVRDFFSCRWQDVFFWTGLSPQGQVGMVTKDDTYAYDGGENLTLE
jgi:hypothetical protein